MIRGSRLCVLASGSFAHYDFQLYKAENMHALALELDELYRTPTPVDPEEEARRQAEFEAHERHDSFAALIADMRDNEDYFTRYTGNAYFHFLKAIDCNTVVQIEVSALS